MKEITFLDWNLLVDDERTKLAYQSVVGTTESCDCHWCSNFVVVRDKCYPNEVLTLLSQLGIDHTKEADLYQQARDETKNAIFIVGGFILSERLLKERKRGSSFSKTKRKVRIIHIGRSIL